jgi:hypothetical protein
LAQAAPQIYDLPFLHRQMLEVLGIKNAAKIVPMEDDQKPKDPVSENMSGLKMEPLKAFLYQNHDAHLAVHNALLQDPSFMQQVQNNPTGQQIMGAMQAHVMEHMAFKYRRDIEMQLGISLPPPDAPMDEQTELQVSQVTAMAAQRLLQQHILQAQQQQAKQAAQDPIVQMQQQELMLKAQAEKRKDFETQAKIQLDQQKLALENKKVDTSAMKDAAQMRQSEKQANVKHLIDSMRANNPKPGNNPGNR